MRCDSIYTGPANPCSAHLLYANSLVLLDSWLVLGRQASQVVDGLLWRFSREATKTQIQVSIQCDEIWKGCLFT